MKTIQKYVDEISGKEFAKIEDAVKSELKSGGIKKLFGFWKEVDVHGTNCTQRTEEEYLMLVGAFVKAVKEYEPWIASRYDSEGGFQRKYVGAGFIIGRYMDDSNSPLYKYYRTISVICPTCFKQWEQPFYAMRCNHKGGYYKS